MKRKAGAPGRTTDLSDAGGPGAPRGGGADKPRGKTWQLILAFVLGAVVGASLASSWSTPPVQYSPPPSMLNLPAPATVPTTEPTTDAYGRGPTDPHYGHDHP